MTKTEDRTAILQAALDKMAHDLAITSNLLREITVGYYVCAHLGKAAYEFLDSDRDMRFQYEKNPTPLNRSLALQNWCWAREHMQDKADAADFDWPDLIDNLKDRLREMGFEDHELDPDRIKP